MKIEGVKIQIHTHQGNIWGRNLSFLNSDGEINQVNLIFGANELGKSTLLNCIIYCLKGEDVYGGSGGGSKLSNALTRTIGGEIIKTSTIYLQLNNGTERLVIERNALLPEEAIYVYRGIQIKDISVNSQAEIFKSKKDKNIEGNKTINEFLMEYFDMPQYKIKDIKDSEKAIYFQNYIPLFFIHQHAWVDIQTTNPYYGISEVKKLVFQLIMNLSEVNNINDRLKLQALKAELREKEQSKELLLDVVSVTEYNESKTIAEKISLLESDLFHLNNSLHEIQESQTIFTENYDTDREEYSKLRNDISDFEDQSNTLTKEIDQYTYYLNKLTMDIEKTDILKTAKKIISGLPISKCPHCYGTLSIDANKEMETGDCTLCGHHMVISKNSDTDQLLEYLKDERKDFEKLKQEKEEKKVEIQRQLFKWKIKIQEYKNKIDQSQLLLTPTFMKEHFNISNKIGSKGNQISNLKKEQKIIETFEKLVVDIHNLEIEIRRISKKIRDSEKQGEDEMKIQHFENKFKEYLKEIDFLKYENIKKPLQESDTADEMFPQVDPIALKFFNLLKIDRTDFKPKIENENIYNLTSASGLVRIINAYYLAFLETCLHFKSTTFHPGVLLLDEPRQQNLDLGSYKKLTKLYIDLKNRYSQQYQIIFTSGNRGVIKPEEILLDLGEDNYLLEKMN